MKEFLKNALENMPEQAQESFMLSLIMNDPSSYAAKVRHDYYKTKFKHMGEHVSIGVGVKIVNPEYIWVGDNVHIGDNVTLIAAGEGGITLEGNNHLKDRVYLDSEREDTGYIHVGKNVYIGTGTTLHGHMGLEIGDHCLLAQNISLTPYSHKYEDQDQVIAVQGGHCRKVTIGRDCYIGMSTTILYSADIGEGSVIGSGAVVVKPIPPYSVAVGVPAKVIRKRKE